MTARLAPSLVPADSALYDPVTNQDASGGMAMITNLRETLNKVQACGPLIAALSDSKAAAVSILDGKAEAEKHIHLQAGTWNMHALPKRAMQTAWKMRCVTCRPGWISLAGLSYLSLPLR